jgi:checkpoint serine/threonine-protein kinase
VAWEYLLLKRLHARINASHAPLYLLPLRLHILADCCIFVSPFGTHGTLQDVINVRGGVSELVAAFYAIELLRCIEWLHDLHVLHFDVKPDNVLLRLGGEQWGHWTASGWWPERGVQLIDFGESFDLADYPHDAVFVGDSATDFFSCVPMLGGAPWRWQPDTFGVLSCVHALLHGSYMSVDLDQRSGRWHCCTPWKRYHAVDVWRPMFDELLNAKGAERVPLAPLREQLEQWLGRKDRAATMRKELLELTIKLASTRAS